MEEGEEEEDDEDNEEGDLKDQVRGQRSRNDVTNYDVIHRLQKPSPSVSSNRDKIDDVNTWIDHHAHRMIIML